MSRLGQVRSELNGVEWYYLVTDSLEEVGRWIWGGWGESGGNEWGHMIWSRVGSEEEGLGRKTRRWMMNEGGNEWDGRGRKGILKERIGRTSMNQLIDGSLDILARKWRVSWRELVWGMVVKDGIDWMTRLHIEHDIKPSYWQEWWVSALVKERKSYIYLSILSIHLTNEQLHEDVMKGRREDWWVLVGMDRD